MENYKIKLNNEAESKEAQELFFELGYEWNGSGKEVIKRRIGLIFTKEFHGKDIICHSCEGDEDIWSDYEGKEITLPKLRDLVQSKSTEQGLISGADAKLAWANGEDVEFHYADTIWAEIPSCAQLSIFDDEEIKFRLKPRTITLSIEIPAPFEPKEGDVYWHISPVNECGYKSKIYQEGFNSTQFGAWRTEEQVKQVVAALRGGIKA